MDRHHTNSEALRAAVIAECPDVLLSFSAGKDALACWYALLESGSRVHPFYLYTVPGLGFVERALTRYEQHFGCSIPRLPHPSLVRMLRNMVFQPPERCKDIEDAELRPIGYEDIEDYARELYQLPDAWVANGSRMADSQTRMCGIKRHGSANPGRKQFFAIYDWRVADLERCFDAHDAFLPEDYQMFGRSFDGIHAEYLRPIKERFPEDYARIVEIFPMVEMEALRHGF